MSERYVFIIHTDQYAGNFERELCAYCTGVVGRCEVGDKERDKFIADYGKEKSYDMEELLEQRSDDNGCLRPVSMCSPGNNSPGNNSLEIYFYDRPTQEIIDIIKERAKKFTQGVDRVWEKPRTMKILGFELKVEITTTEYIDI